MEAARKPSLSEEGKAGGVVVSNSINGTDTEDASETDLAPKLEDGR